MEEVKRCTKCVLPSTLQGITFDENGVCNYCRAYEKNFKDWDKIEARKKAEFESILLKAQKLKRPYDCLVPLSGGKDSTYVLYLCTKVYKMKTLAVTLDHGFLSNPAKENIKNAISATNADHIFYTINRENSNQLFKTFVEKTGNFCSACMRQINYAVEIAVKIFNVPLVIQGSGRRVEYVSQIKEVSSLHTPSYFANVLKGTDSEERFNFLSSNKYKLEFQRITGGILDILGLKRSSLMRFFSQHLALYDYIYKPYPEIIEILKREMNWKDVFGFIEHLDCELHDVPFYVQTLRIRNISKSTLHSSGLIRQGIMSRDEALQKEEFELKNDNPPKELLRFLENNQITLEEYTDIVKHANTSQYEPKLQNFARDIYHKFRKF